jgi:hypothetical protein
MRPIILCVMIRVMMVAQLVVGQTQDDRAVDSVDLSVHASVDQERREPQALQNAPIHPTTLSRWSYPPVRPSATPRVGPSQEGFSGASGSDAGNPSPVFGTSRPAGRLVLPESTTTTLHEQTARTNLGKPTKRPSGFNTLHRDHANDASVPSPESAGPASPGPVSEQIQAFHKPFLQGGSGTSTALNPNSRRKGQFKARRRAPRPDTMP